MENKLKIAVVKSIVSANDRQAVIEGDKLDLEVGDVVLVGRNTGALFGSFDVGRVERIYETDLFDFSGERNLVVEDVITDSSKVFKGLKQKLRKVEIKKEIAERMKKVDERQRMEMYASTDDTIAELMKELDQLKG